MQVLLNMWACDAKLVYKFHQPNSNNFNCNPVVLKNKIGKRSLWAKPKTNNNFFNRNNKTRS